MGKQVIINNGFTSENKNEIAIEVAKILNKNNFNRNNFASFLFASEGSIIELRLCRVTIWKVEYVSYNDAGIIDYVDLSY